MKEAIGEMAWLDLSVQNATEVKDFYQNVIGWQTSEVSMGDYQDYAMLTPGSGDAVAGICHAKGCNIDLPAAWLPYFLVEDIEQAVTATKEKGGELITDIKSMGQDKYAVIKDPAGAVCAIYQKATS
ncbi:VOC family protein [Thalassotalea hakodatensis]|uniref:VOC family protein n=1 Tax=Thalassotalea hakodatensis TaxID=3030492 RepID=UPI00257276CB|nr:VOC family protein [Thalassotalea hakodatensis]